VAKNDQEDGWGARGSIKIVKSFGNVDFLIQPYYRFWNLKDADLIEFLQCLYSYDFDYDWLKEPKNSTTEWGTRVGISF
jgi:hypothetical protein